MHSLLRSDLLLAAEETSVNPLIPQIYDIVYSIVALIVVFWVFWKYVLPKYQKVMQERTELIEGGIAKAEKAQAEANHQLAEYQAQLQQATDEAKQIREEAVANGKKLIAQMKATGQAESDRIIANATKQLESEKQQILNELRVEVGTTAANLAEKIVGEALVKDVKKAGTVDDFLKDLDKLAP